MSRARELLALLIGAQAGGFLAQPPGVDGEPGLGIAGVSGVPRGRTWDAVASARCPDLTGESVTFVALADGTLIVDDDVPDDSLGPLADALEETLEPPYRGAALRNERDVWSVVAESVSIVEIPRLDGDALELSLVGGVRELSVEREATIMRIPALDELAARHGDVALRAERIDDDLFAVDVFPL